jgi:L-ascorbate metabolism protein UlaG (beta-lactamase superfamily)
MPSTITDRSSKEQIRLDRQRTQSAAYPRLFAEMAADWNSGGPGDRAWLVYSANYVLRTAGVLWALDPLTMHRRLPETPVVDIEAALETLDFIVLTHGHKDHLDFDLFNKLRHLPIRWVIPQFLLSSILAKAVVDMDQVIVPVPLQPIEMNGIRFLPFEGLHWKESADGRGKHHLVPALGYLVEFKGKRWLFPGDTRNYRAELLPPFGPLDGMFAHLWLGRVCALMGDPPLLDKFCRFCTDLQPKRVVLTHLEEFGREADDYWEERHARMVISHLSQSAPEIPVESAYTGNCVIL